MVYDDLHHLYIEMVKCNSVMNDLAYSLYFHSLLGSYFKKYIIRWGVTNKDLRIHPFWIQDSRTGKDQLNKCHSLIGKECGLTICYETDITGDASLIGSYDTEAERYNTEHGLTLANPQKAGKKGSIFYVYKDPIIKGDLGTYDIVIVGEAKLFTQTGSEKILTVIQPALDYPGFVRKKMRHTKAIEYNCDATLISTTIPFKRMNSLILNQGFYMRTALLINKLTFEKIKIMRKEARKLRALSYRQKFDECLQKFSSILKEYDREQRYLFVTPEANKRLEIFSEKFDKYVEENLQGKELQAAISFTQTFEDIVLKMAGHIAILDTGNKNEEINILSEHIDKAYYPAFQFSRSIVEELEVEEDVSTAKELEQIKKVVALYKTKNILPNTEELIEGIKCTLNIGIRRAKKLFEMYRDNRIIKECRGGKNEKFWDI